MNTSNEATDHSRLAERVSRAVAREDRKRRTLMIVFLVLLLVPVAVGAVLVSKGLSEARWIEEKARAVAGAEVEPVLRDAKAWNTRLNALETQVPDAMAVIDEIRPVIPRVAQVATTLESYDSRVSAIEDTTEQQERRLGRAIVDTQADLSGQTARLERLEQGQREVAARFENVARLVQQPPDNERFETLTRRIQELETEMTDSRREIVKLRAEVLAKPAISPVLLERLERVEKKVRTP